MRQKSKEKREKEETLVFADPTFKKKNAAVPVCILHRRPEHRYASNADDNVN